MDIQDTKEYIEAVENYLDTDIDYCANTIIHADEDDLRQLAQDSFHAGVKWCESQKAKTGESNCTIDSVKHRALEILAETVVQAPIEDVKPEIDNDNAVVKLRYCLEGIEKALVDGA